MARNLTPEELKFLLIFRQVARSYGEPVKRALEWADSLIAKGAVSALDDGTLDMYLSRFNEFQGSAASISVFLDYPRTVPLQYYNQHFDTDEHHISQAEYINRILYEGWKWFSKKELLSLDYPVVKARANVTSPKDPVNMEFGMGPTDVTPRQMLQYLCWFNQVWCSDEAIASRFDITLVNRPGVEFQISLTPSMFGDIQVVDGNF